MTVEGVDFSDGRPGGAALVAAGKTFVCRYVPYGGYAKGLTAAEVADYHAHGLGIVLVWEQVANRALQGRAAGVTDATTSRDAAKALGFPSTRPIYIGVDFDSNATQYPAIDDYFAGVVSVLGLARTGVYGEAALCAHLQAAGLASWFWQTTAWSGGTAFVDRHLLQYLNGQSINGAGVDLDRAYKPDFGQWPGPQAAGGDPMLKRKAEGWTTNSATVPFYDSPGGTQLGNIPTTGTPLSSIGETTDGVWRLIAISGTAGADPRWVYMNRQDLTPMVAGGDPAFDTAVQNLIIARKAPQPPPPPPADTTPFTQADVDAKIAVALAAQEQDINKLQTTIAAVRAAVGA